MLPPDLNTWDRHKSYAGRAGQPARAFLSVEASAFQKVKPKRKQVKNEGDKDNGAGKKKDEEDEHEDDPFEKEPFQYRKKVDVSLREYIDTTGCRHDISDAYISNPTPRPGAQKLHSISLSPI